MATVRCAFCGDERDPSYGYIRWCPKCELWVCYKHAKTYCPKCGGYLK
jgi:ribosomal protein S27E